jgi:hypothetical protein
MNSAKGGTTYTRNPMESGIGSRQARPPLSAPQSVDGSALIAAREEERIRLAEELHDGTAQALANALFQIGIVERALRGHPDEAAAELGALRTILERELNTLRAYINQLRPSLGEPTSLDEALRDTVDGIAERSPLAVDVQLEAPAERLEQAGRTTVLRVAQEALRRAACLADDAHRGAGRPRALDSGSARRRRRLRPRRGDRACRPAAFWAALHARTSGAARIAPRHRHEPQVRHGRAPYHRSGRG